MKKSTSLSYFLVRAGDSEHLALSASSNDALALVAKDFLTVAPAKPEDFERLIGQGQSIVREAAATKRGPKPKAEATPPSTEFGG